MRLDAAKGDKGYECYHVPTCTRLKYTVWVDDETAQWCEFVQPLRVVDGQVARVVCQAKRIEIHLAARLVLIDPVDDPAPDGEVMEADLPMPEVGASAAPAAEGGPAVAPAPQVAGPSGETSSEGNSNPVVALVHGRQLC